MRPRLLLLLLALSPTTGAEPPPPLAVRMVRPRRGAIIRYVTLPGSIRANQEVTLYGKVAGYLKQITVDKGTAVQPGELLAEIEVPELAADLKRQLAEAKVAEIDLQRMGDAQKKAPDLVLPQALDRARGAYDSATASMERTQTLLGYGKIHAPFGGIITMRYVDLGAFVPAATGTSNPRSAALLTLMDFTTVRVQVGVPEMEVPLVRTGQPVRVTLEEMPGRTFEGEVTRFSYALDEATRTMLVEIDLPNEKQELRPGMYANVKIGVEKHEDALLIPAEALVMEKAAAFVFKNASGVAKKTPVKAGFDDGANVEMMSGVEPADSVIVAGKLPLTDGQPVQPAVAK